MAAICVARGEVKLIHFSRDVPIEKDTAIIGCGDTDLAKRIALYVPTGGQSQNALPPMLDRPVELAGLNTTYRNQRKSYVLFRAIPRRNSELRMSRHPVCESPAETYAEHGGGMKTIAVASAPASARERTTAAPQAFLIWLIPAFYQLSLTAMFRSAEFTRVNMVLGSGLLAVAIASRCGEAPDAIGLPVPALLW